MVFVNEASVQFTHTCVQFSSIAFLYYDYFLTFPSEVKYIWFGKVRYTTWLYIGCRFGLLGNLLYLLTLFSKLHNPKKWLFFVTALSIVGRMCILIIWTVRTWAIWHRQMWVIYLLAPWALACVLLDVISATPSSTEPATHALTLLYLVLDWISASLASYQCVRTLWTRKNLNMDSASMKNNFTFQIFWEGLFYIFCISVFTLTDAALEFQSPIGSFQQKVMTAYTLPVSGLLTARFILYMRASDTPAHFDATNSRPMNQTLSDPVFTGLVVHRRGSASFDDDDYIYEDEPESSNSEIQERRRDQSSKGDKEMGLGRTRTHETSRTYVHSEGTGSSMKSGEYSMGEKGKKVDREGRHQGAIIESTMLGHSDALADQPSDTSPQQNIREVDLE